jgi:ABC-type cobalamin/Fe3+-siderophores transport system ATPase subunit
MVVHHDLATAAEYFDSLVLIKQRLYAHGPPDLVLNPELLSRVYEGNLRLFASLANERPSTSTRASRAPVRETDEARKPDAGSPGKAQEERGA